MKQNKIAVLRHKDYENEEVIYVKLLFQPILCIEITDELVKMQMAISYSKITIFSQSAPAICAFSKHQPSLFDAGSSLNFTVRNMVLAHACIQCCIALNLVA